MTTIIIISIHNLKIYQRFKDSIIKNCHTKAGSLIEFNKHWGNRKSKFENSQFISKSLLYKIIIIIIYFCLFHFDS